MENKNIKLKELNLNDLVIFENRVYKVIKSPYNKNKGQQGLRVMLILLKQNELNEIVINTLNNFDIQK